MSGAFGQGFAADFDVLNTGFLSTENAWGIIPLASADEEG